MAMFKQTSVGPISYASGREGTCLYVRLASGLEIFNATRYKGAYLPRAQAKAAEYFGITALATLFVEEAPERVTPVGLVFLALQAQFDELRRDLFVGKVVDVDKLEVVGSKS